MKIIKNDFINELGKTGIPESDAKRIVQFFMDSVINSLVSGKQVNLTNFGMFRIVQKKKTSFVNPKTGQISHVKRPKKVRFKASRNLIRYINEP